MAFTPPQTYTAYAFLERGGPLREIQVPWKNPEPGRVVVRVLADQVTKDQWFPTTVFPRVPGHEIIGDVVAIGQGETTWKVGDRVGAGWFAGYCKTCDRCRKGDFVTCRTMVGQANGVGTDGGYAEYATVRSESLAKIPTDIDPVEAAPLLCAGVTCFNALRNMHAPIPSLVAIQGIGGLGHLAIQFSHRMGFRTVALSSTADKKELAMELGADDFISGSAAEQATALKAMGGAHVILCTAPDPEGMSTLIDGLTFDGQFVVLPLVPKAISVPILTMLSQRLSIRGWPYGTGMDCEDTVNFSKLHGIKAMVKTFPLNKSDEAYEHRSTARFRAVIIP
ncbi:uncharacterized protein FIBRA_07439 [Fibroporia radiculosa]|uniref:Enoyl reductase (ER) domain-containing protein n=1 Tax=Fibroporia radiculosa TaxID=599839 RepID=J4H4M1_9APHY|nr:uncharacterized protein FIBRA_07439 [Fibroporia radiculosa]CCM05229.1 predicted protein [Fibroporia radiculosa]